MDNPLGILYFARTPDGDTGLGFVEFRDQSPDADHRDEWMEIFGEIADRSLVPLSMMEHRQSEWRKLAARVSSAV